MEGWSSKPVGCKSTGSCRKTVSIASAGPVKMVFFRGFSVFFFVALICLEKDSVWAFFVAFRGPHFGQVLRVLALEKSSEVNKGIAYCCHGGVLGSAWLRKYCVIWGHCSNSIVVLRNIRRLLPVPCHAQNFTDDLARAELKVTDLR